MKHPVTVPKALFVELAMSFIEDEIASKVPTTEIPDHFDTLFHADDVADTERVQIRAMFDEAWIGVAAARGVPSNLL